MKKILLSIALVLGVPAMLFADRIPADKALRIAREFVGNSVPSSMMKQACIREIPVLASQTDGHYVFNVGRGNGYVVVAGDDMVKDAVLGYADSERDVHRGRHAGEPALVVSRIRQADSLHAAAQGGI